MSLPTFFADDYQAGQRLVELNQQETAHAVKARRLGEGRQVQLLNGKGLTASATIKSVDRHSMTVKVDKEFQEPVSDFELSIAFALPKGDRQRTMIDMLTQLGVDRLIPIDCDRSVSKFNEKMQSKFSRYAIEACKQSQNPWLPKIESMLTLEELIDKFSGDSELLYTDLHAEHQLMNCDLSDDLVMIIGPEGGFSEREFRLMSESRARSVWLAPRILRTETAAITAAAQIIASRR